jgi:hypothetical protein
MLYYSRWLMGGHACVDDTDVAEEDRIVGEVGGAAPVADVIAVEPLIC